jgi:virginiamycin B lyase
MHLRTACLIVLATVVAGCTTRAGQVAPTAFVQTSGNSLRSNSSISIETIYGIPAPGMRAHVLATGPDHNVWFTMQDTYIAKATAAGVFTEYSLPSGPTMSPYELTSGPLGDMWFTVSGASIGCRIGRISMTGAVKLYRSLPHGECAFYLTAGPDGNLWFTDLLHVGRLTPSGNIKEFGNYTSSNEAGDIAAGPDGNLWYTIQPNSFGKITTSGVITQYQGPSNDQGNHIVAGADGNLYASSNNGIERITVTGYVTQYTQGEQYWGEIILGPDRQLWMTNLGTNDVVEFDPKTNTFSPVITVFQAPGITGLAINADNDVWVGGWNANAIAVLEKKH